MSHASSVESYVSDPSVSLKPVYQTVWFRAVLPTVDPFVAVPGVEPVDFAVVSVEPPALVVTEVPLLDCPFVDAAGSSFLPQAPSRRSPANAGAAIWTARRRAWVLRV
jgi:hypothetical protein